LTSYIAVLSRRLETVSTLKTRNRLSAAFAKIGGLIKSSAREFRFGLAFALLVVQIDDRLPSYLRRSRSRFATAALARGRSSVGAARNVSEGRMLPSDADAVGDCKRK
jgi:hypothetical protein